MVNFLNWLARASRSRAQAATKAALSTDTPRDSLLKYYIYISNTKVDMLFPQIPQNFLKDLDVEFKATVGIASASIKRSATKDPSELESRVAIIRSFINSHDQVGDVKSPKSWISGTYDLKWGIVTEYASDIVFFGQVLAGKRLALLGAKESLIGEAKTSEANHAPYYYTLRFLNDLISAEENMEASDGDDESIPPYVSSYKQAVDIALKALPAGTTKVEFLAKVLHNDSACLIATPLYVAMGD